MGLKFQKICKMGILTTVGYILSPLSWWNDLVINIPISWLIASLISKIKSSFFEVSFILAYWLTNVLGLILFHLGLREIISSQAKNKKKLILNDILLSIVYTILIFIFIKLKIIKPFWD